MTMLIAIDAPHFYAAVELVNGHVQRAAPIIKWMEGKSLAEVERRCKLNGWRVTKITLAEELDPRTQEVIRTNIFTRATD